MTNKIILLLLTLFISCFAYFSFDGFHFYDDTGYIEKAYFLRHQSLENILNNTNEQAHRFGFLLPLAAFQTLLPFHEITHIIWILVCTLSGIYIVYHCLSSYCKNIALYASLLLGLDYYYLYLCNKVYPDTQTAILCLLSAIIFWKNSDNIPAKISSEISSKIATKTTNSLINSFLFASAIFIALLCKLTAIFVLPFYFFLFVNNLLGGSKPPNRYLSLRFWFQSGSKPPNRYLSLCFWFQSIAFALLFLFGYLAVYQYVTGDFLFRFHLVEANRYADALSYFDKSFDKLLIRLTYEPILMFLKAGYFVNFWLAIPILFSVPFSVAADFSPQKNMSEMKFWVHLLISMLAFYWFGSTSLAVYSPIPLDYRMFVIISPIMAIVAALGLQESFTNKNYQTIYSLGFFVAALISKFYLQSPNYLIYSLLAILFLCIKYQKPFDILFDFQNKKTFQKQKSFWKVKLLLESSFTFQKFHFYLTLLVIILLIHPCYTLLQSNSANYFSEKHVMTTILTEQSKQINKPIIVYTDSRLAESAAFYYEFQIPKNLKFTAFDTLKEIPKQALTLSDTLTYLLVNHKTIKYLQDYTGKKFPSYVQNSSQNKPINYKVLYDKNEVILVILVDLKY